MNLFFFAAETTIQVDATVVYMALGVIVSMQTWILREVIRSKVRRHEQAARIIALKDEVEQLTLSVQRIRHRLQID